MSQRDYNAMSDLTEKLLGRDVISMSEVEMDVLNCPANLETAEKEIERLRKLVVSLAKNEVSEAGKQLLLCDVE